MLLNKTFIEVMKLIRSGSKYNINSDLSPQEINLHCVLIEDRISINSEWLNILPSNNMNCNLGEYYKMQYKMYKSMTSGCQIVSKYGVCGKRLFFKISALLRSERTNFHKKNG